MGRKAPLDGASIHQANLLLSANVFAHLEEQARLKPSTELTAPDLLWHVIDHDDCRDKRFRQARLPALNGSQRLQAISIPMLSNRTMASVPLQTGMKDILLDELKGYANANLGRLLDLAAWFGSRASKVTIGANLDAICDAISSSQASDVVGLNIDIASLFAREWLGRTVKVVRSTQLYQAHQGLTREMLRQVQEAALSRGADLGEGTCHVPRWDWWVLRSDGRRERPEAAPAPHKRGIVGGVQLFFSCDLTALDKVSRDAIVVPGVLADTIADARIRELTYATQYWRSQSLLTASQQISAFLWGCVPRSYLVGAPGSFIVPAAQPPSWLSPIEMEGFMSGIYSVVLYWLIGLRAAPSRVMKCSLLRSEAASRWVVSEA